MRNITETFEATASSVYDLFNSEFGVCSFRVPIYQRQYSWEDAPINRLFDDTIEGLIALGSEEDYLTFLGTLVLVEEGDKKEHTFDGTSLSIVDGQQRVTTLALTCCALFAALVRYSETDAGESPFDSTLREEKQFLCDHLFYCAVGRPNSPRPPLPYEYFPRIVRERSDTRAASSSEASYESPVADYLFAFASAAGQGHPIPLAIDGYGPETEGFNRRLKLIANRVQRIAADVNGSTLQPFPKTHRLLGEPKYRRVLFPWLQQRTHLIKDVLSGVHESDNEGPRGALVRLVAFGNYLIRRVAITRVVAEDERYAFDIFEALNTTGEPLTAIETFKPAVIRFEDQSHTGYERSESKQWIGRMEEHLRGYRTYEAQQRESREVVLLLALYASGERLGRQLNQQRRYLRTTYEAASSGAAKGRLVRALAEIAEYRDRFWTLDALPHQLRIGEDEDGEVARFCLQFIREINSSLTIPILCRYWVESERQRDPTMFVDAVKAVTAFLVLRRGATGGTAAIDSDYRRLMSNGAVDARDEEGALRLRLEDDGDVVSVQALKGYLRGYLRQKRLLITGREAWVRRVCQQPLYRSAATLCRFMLLTAAHNAVQDEVEAYLLRRARRSQERNYMSLMMWRSRDTATIEHVAPQSPSEGWSDSLYEADDLVHVLGNLTLLPENMNSSIADKSWSKKSLFYKAAAAGTERELAAATQQARAEGLDLGKRMNEMLEKARCLPILTAVAAAESWDGEVVARRTENIAGLVWDEVSTWLSWDGQ